MDFATARGKAVPRVPLRHGEGNKDHLTSFGGLAALSLDALSSVAYGPEAIVLVLALPVTPGHPEGLRRRSDRHGVPVFRQARCCSGCRC